MLEPVPEIFQAARLLEDAVDAHLAGEHDRASLLLRRADMAEIRTWSGHLWGRYNPAIQGTKSASGSGGMAGAATRFTTRMLPMAVQRAVIERDGYHCRFCGIPVARKDVRQRLSALYPCDVPWGKTNASQHAAFQAIWLQFDHVIPHARGGDNSTGNLVVTCAPCKCGRMDTLLEDADIDDPRSRPVSRSEWDGLERIYARRPHVLSGKPL